MALREDLLTPIAGDDPSGISLRYDRVYDQIKEARTEEDQTLPSGQWERTAKRADYPLVLKLAGEALATRSKDLQLAVWLGEAEIKRQGTAALTPVLTLLLNLQQQFWDTIFPEIDEGDAGFRAVPLQWASTRYSALVYDTPLTASKVAIFEYRAARALPTEDEGNFDDTKREKRAAAASNGELLPEEIDEAVAKTPKAFYAGLHDTLGEAQDALVALDDFCESHYGEDGPSFRKLHDSLDQVQNVVGALLAAKRALDPDPVEDEEPEAEEPEAEEEPEADEIAAEEPETETAIAEDDAPAAVVPRRKAPAASARSGIAAEPTSWDDAVERVQRCAAFLQTAQPGSVLPYLLQTSVRLAELREQGHEPALDFLVPPETEVRLQLKQLAAAGEWDQVLMRAMEALATPAGRVWLDVHRYLWNAASQGGYTPLASAVILHVRQVLREFQALPTWSFADDTPVSNGDTVRWIAEEVAEAVPVIEVEEVIAEPVRAYIPPPQPATAEDDADSAPDVLQQATALAAAGQLGAATVLLSRDAAQQASGRMRYSRRVQIAELCLSAGNAGVATPILRELIDEMERRNLESWEAGDLITKPIALLLRSQNGSMEAAEREALFMRLCRLDPSAALDME